MVYAHFVLGAAALASLGSARSNLEARQIHVHPVDVGGNFLPRIETGLNTVTGPGANDNDNVAATSMGGVASHVYVTPSAFAPKISSSPKASLYSPIPVLSKTSGVSKVPVASIAAATSKSAGSGSKSASRNVVYITMTTYYIAEVETAEVTEGFGEATSSESAVENSSEASSESEAETSTFESASESASETAFTSNIASDSPVAPTTTYEPAEPVTSEETDASTTAEAPASTSSDAEEDTEETSSPVTTTSDEPRPSLSIVAGALGADGIRSVAPHLAPNGVAQVNGAAGAAVPTTFSIWSATIPASVLTNHGPAMTSIMDGAVENVDPTSTYDNEAEEYPASATAEVDQPEDTGFMSSPYPEGDDSESFPEDNEDSSTGAIHVYPVDANEGFLNGIETGANTVTGTADAEETDFVIMNYYY